MAVFINDDQKELFVDSEILEKQGKNILFSLGCENQELSILLTNDEKIKELNKQYRGYNEATDVLSFPQNEEKESKFSSLIMGDVVISTATAKRQASEHGLSSEEEIVLLLIHGILHLIGFDHERSEEEDFKMKRKTQEIFNRIFPNKKPKESCDLYS